MTNQPESFETCQDPMGPDERTSFGQKFGNDVVSQLVQTFRHIVVHV